MRGLFPLAERSLLLKFKRRRANKRKVPGLWMRVHGKREVKRIYGDHATLGAKAEKFVASQGWRLRFLRALETRGAEADKPKGRSSPLARAEVAGVLPPPSPLHKRGGHGQRDEARAATCGSLTADEVKLSLEHGGAQGEGETEVAGPGPPGRLSRVLGCSGRGWGRGWGRGTFRGCGGGKGPSR